MVKLNLSTPARSEVGVKLSHLLLLKFVSSSNIMQFRNLTINLKIIHLTKQAH